MHIKEHEFREAMRSYVDLDGLVSINPGSDRNDSGNGLLHLSVYLCQLAHRGWLRDTDLNALYASLRACQVRYKGVPLPWYWRAPQKRNPDDTQSHDDYIGLAAAWSLSEEGHWMAEWFCNFSQYHWWFLDHQNPNSWNLRFFTGWRLAVVSHYYMAYTKPLLAPVFISIAIIANMLSSQTKHDQNQHIWLMIETGKEKSPLIKFFGNLWEKRTRQRFGSIGLSFANYYRSLEHPLTWLD